jgi:hypothetical protein
MYGCSGVDRPDGGYRSGRVRLGKAIDRKRALVIELGAELERLTGN